MLQTEYVYKDATLDREARIDDLLRRMTLAEKVGQMTQPEKNSVPLEDVTTYGLGSVLSGGGGHPTKNTPEEWVKMVSGFHHAALETRLGIPLLYGVDAVHGHNNMHGAVIFPHNIGLGATRDADLVQRVAAITAKEVMATHIQWNFAPAVPVPQDIRWGRTYEGFGDNTELVTELGAAYTRGLQNGADGRLGLDHPHTVLASIKHFVGDGGAQWDTISTYPWLPHMWNSPTDRWSIDQGVTAGDEANLRAMHLPPYAAAVEAGALNVMASYTSWDGVKMHEHKYLLTDVLKGELGFAGFVVSDFMAINQLEESYYNCVVRSINAGMDMIMVPHDYKLFIKTLTETVVNGDVPEARVDDAVRRILRAKFALGLFERPFAPDSLLDEVGCEAHREVAREAVRKSAVLLKNENDTLPISEETHRILVAGAGADEIGMQCGGWSIDWQGKRGAITPGATMWEGVQEAAGEETAVAYSATGTFVGTPKAEIGIVVVGEEPYAEGEGDRADLSLSAEDIAVLERVRPLVEKLVVVLLSGRPLIVTDHIDQWDAFVAAWLPGSEANAIADVLFGEYPFTGKLSFRWPRRMEQIPLGSGDGEPLFPSGFGL